MSAAVSKAFKVGSEAHTLAVTRLYRKSIRFCKLACISNRDLFDAMTWRVRQKFEENRGLKNPGDIEAKLQEAHEAMDERFYAPYHHIWDQGGTKFLRHQPLPVDMCMGDPTHTSVQASECDPEVFGNMDRVSDSNGNPGDYELEMASFVVPKEFQDNLPPGTNVRHLVDGRLVDDDGNTLNHLIPEEKAPPQFTIKGELVDEKDIRVFSLDDDKPLSEISPQPWHAKPIKDKSELPQNQPDWPWKANKSKTQ